MEDPVAGEPDEVGAGGVGAAFDDEGRRRGVDDGDLFLDGRRRGDDDGLRWRGRRGLHDNDGLGRRRRRLVDDRGGRRSRGGLYDDNIVVVAVVGMVVDVNAAGTAGHCHGGGKEDGEDEGRANGGTHSGFLCEKRRLHFRPVTGWKIAAVFCGGEMVHRRRIGRLCKMA